MQLFYIGSGMSKDGNNRCLLVLSHTLLRSRGYMQLNPTYIEVNSLDSTRT